MSNLLDVHTHTLASGHAYSTILEMARTAKDRGLEILGITEHAPTMPGTCDELYFTNLKVIDRNLFGLELLMGVELNIIDYKGNVDIRDETIERLDISIACLHYQCIEPGTIIQNTEALIGAMENPLIDIIGHPDDGRYPTDYKEMVLAAKEFGKIIELNNSSLDPLGFRINTKENSTKILEHCAENQVNVILSSDAHFAESISDFYYANELVKEMDFPKELILNNNLDKFRSSILKYKKI